MSTGMWVLRGLAAVLLLILMIIGVGTVMFYVYDGATLTALAIGASLVVIAWHGLRGIGPRGEFDSPREEWTFALVGVALFGAWMALVLWNPWFMLAYVVFPVWARIRGRL
jgi:hypothetical protein